MGKFNAIYHNRKSVLIPYGFTRVQKDLTHLQKAEKFTIGYCGRIAIYPKGLGILLEGFALFHLACPQSQLLIIGDGKDMGKLEKMAADLKISMRFNVRGRFLEQRKRPYWRNAMCLPIHPEQTDCLRRLLKPLPLTSRYRFRSHQYRRFHQQV